MDCLGGDDDDDDVDDDKLAICLAEIQDAIEVLAGGLLHPDAVADLEEAKLAAEDEEFDDAIDALIAARNKMVN